MTAPGWYPDPSDPSRQRFFDGHTWTDQYAPLASPPVNAVSNPKSGMSKGAKIGIGVGAAVVGLAVLGSIGNSSKPSGTSHQSAAERIADAITPGSGFTTAQDNAIAKAKIYLNTVGGFSEQGLINQLVIGDKFSQADATFAVTQIESSGDVNWNEQAANKAKTYMSISGFSLDGLINQLEVGDKFTPAQAQYGARIAYGS